MKNKAWKIAIVLLVIMSLSCNFVTGLLADIRPGGSQDSAADSQPAQGTQQPQADYYDAGGNPVDYEPPASDLVELLLAGVEAGQLELEQGVLDLMALMAGEGERPDYTDQAEGGVEFRSGWGLSLLAYQIYQNTEDEELRAQLQALHRRLAPPMEAITAYAEPAESFDDSSSARPNGLSLQTDCSTIWADGFPESAGPAPMCYLYSFEFEGGYEYFVYHPVEMEDNPAQMAYVQAAREALTESRQRYSEWFEVRSVYIVFSPVSATDIGGPVGGSAFVPALNVAEMGDAPCPITVVKGALDNSIEAFKQIIAHEVFHCVSLWRRGFNGYDATDWMDEGIAEYFSNVVYPNANNEHGSVFKFHGKSTTNSIFQMSYENAVFFQYLGNRFGNEWLVQFFDDMPTETTQAMLNHMSGLPEMDEIFQDFAKDYLDGKIMDTGGGALPGTALFLPEQSYFLPSNGEVEIEAKSFQIQRARVTFEGENKFDLELDLEGGAARETSRRSSSQQWEPLPQTVSTCQQPLTYLEAVTSTEASSIGTDSARFTISLSESEENSCDECLVGIWKHDFATSEYWDHVFQQSASEATYLDSVAGTRYLTFFDNGNYADDTPSWMTVWASEGVEGNHTEVLTEASASSIGSYNTPGESLLQLVAEDREYYSEVTTIVSGPLGTFSSDPLINTEPNPQGIIAEGAPYECEGDTLRIFNEDPGWNWSGYLIFQRLSDNTSDYNSLVPTP